MSLELKARIAGLERRLEETIARLEKLEDQRNAQVSGDEVEAFRVFARKRK